MSSLKVVYRDMPGQSSPASVDVKTGIIYVNTLVWPLYTPFEQRAILLHEKYHYLSGCTTNEIACDEYAFQQMAGTEKNSLMQFTELIEQLSKKCNDTERVRASQHCAIRSAAQHGSKDAQELLKFLNKK